MIDKILNEYISLFNIKDVHILKQLLQFIDLGKVLDRIAEKKDVVLLHNKEGETINVFFYERN
jgi:hypothetical protein